MRLLASLLAVAVASSAAALAPPPDPTHVVVAGPGEGATTTHDGGLACERLPFLAQVTYFPDGAATVLFTWFGAPPRCLPLQGGMLALGQVAIDPSGSVPSVQWQRPCEGSAPTGATCGNFLQVGPFAGPGSRVWVRSGTFDGSFLAL